MSSSPATARCHECGWSLTGTGAACVACGAPVHRGPAIGASRVDAASLLATHEEDFPELADAFRAFRKQDWARFVPLCLAAVGITRPFAQQRGAVSTWVFSERSAVVILTHDRDDGTLAIDAPVVEVRPDTEVALLRAALSTTSKMGAARPARRGDVLMLTMTHRIEAMPPPRLVHAIRELALACDQLDNLFAFEFGGRLMGPQLRRAGEYDLTPLGQPRKLLVLGGGDRPAPLRPAPRGGAVSLPPPIVGATATATGGTAMSRFLDVVREAQDLMDAATSFGTIEGPLHVALRAALAGGVELDGARMLLRHAQRLRSGHATPPETRVLYRQLLAERGHTSAQWPLAWPRQPAAASKPTLAAAIAHADTTRNLTYRRTLLLGALAELILFCDLTEPLLERLRAIHDGSLATDAATIEALHATLARASR